VAPRQIEPATQSVGESHSSPAAMLPAGWQVGVPLLPIVHPSPPEQPHCGDRPHGVGHTPDDELLDAAELLEAALLLDATPLVDVPVELAAVLPVTPLDELTPVEATAPPTPLDAGAPPPPVEVVVLVESPALGAPPMPVEPPPVDVLVDVDDDEGCSVPEPTRVPVSLPLPPFPMPMPSSPVAHEATRSPVAAKIAACQPKADPPR